MQQTVIAFVGTAAFPRLAHWLRWPTRLGARGFITYVTFNTLLLFAIRTWIVPVVKRKAEEGVRATRTLRMQLGREPGED